MKLVIIEHEPYSVRKKKHYYIDEFVRNNVQVEYWDVSKALKYTKEIQYTNVDESGFVKIFTSIRQIIQEIEKLDVKSTSLIVEIFHRLNTNSIFKTIAKKRLFWSRLNYYHNPTSILAPPPDKRRRIYKLTSSRVWGNIFLKYFGGGIKDPMVYFRTGNLSDKSSRSISLDFFDIEDYRNQGNDGNPLIHTPYIVFLDIMLTKHPDFKRLGINTIDDDIYFTKICGFFDKLESHYKMPVIIASHPKANYKNEFGDREIVQNKTMELIKNAEFVLTHGSLSISFALLFNKPLVYLTFEELNKHPYFNSYVKRMENACDFLSSKLINIDDFSFEDLILCVDEGKYNTFLDLVYRKSKDDFRSNFQILFDTLFQNKIKLLKQP